MRTQLEHGGSTMTTAVKKGIDISEYQGLIDIPTVYKKNNLDFVIIRGGYTGWGYGTQTVDKQFERNYALCRANNIPVGYYYLTIASSDEMVEKELAFIKKQLAGKQFNHIIGIDIEACKYNPSDDHKYDDLWIALHKAERTRLMVKLIKGVEAMGYFVGFYCNLDYATNKLDMNQLKDVTFWFARYIETWPTTPRVPTVWQKQSNARLIGYNDNLDLDYTSIDITEIVTRLGLNKLDPIMDPQPEPEPVVIDYKALYEASQKEIDQLTAANSIFSDKYSAYVAKVKALAKEIGEL